MALNHNIDPYYDDFNKNKNFLRIMFNPSRAVQARELTQAQTILQNQIQNFGDSVFRENSRVIGGEIAAHFDKVTLVVSGGAISDLFVGAVLTKVGDAGTFATVTHVDIPNNALLVDQNGGLFSPADTFTTSIDGITYAINSKHKSLVASINDGIIYNGGMFVNVFAHDLVVDTTSTMATKEFKVGFVSTDTFVTSEMDPTLADGAAGSYNFGAIGADRFRRTLTLSSYEVTRDATGAETTVTPSNFTNILKIVNGVVQSDILQLIKYSEILDTLARRTKDESGDYIVSPFDISTENTTTGNVDTQFDVVFGQGKAYVNGYEAINQFTTRLTLDKARGFDRVNNQSTYVNLGVSFDAGTITGSFDIGANETLNFYSATGGLGSLLGTARLESVVRDSTGDLVLNITNYANVQSLFSSVRSIKGVTSGAISNVLMRNGAPVYRTASKNDGIYNILPASEGDNVKSVIPNSINYNVVKNYSGVVGTGGVTYTLNAPDVTTDFASGGIVYHVADDTGAELLNPADYSFSINNQPGVISTMTITTTASHVNISATVLLYKSQGNAKTKNLVKNFQETQTSDVNGLLTLTKADLLSVATVEDMTVPASPVIVTTGIVDDGQRDFAYDVATISGLTASTDYRVTYDYFDHVGSGDFFTVDSYMGTANIDPVTGYVDLYSRIKTYTATDGTKYKLINCIDTRQLPSNLATSDTFANGSSIGFDYDYYLARYDKVFIDQKGNFGSIAGISAPFPKYPADVSGVLVLATILTPPYTHNPANIKVEMYDSRRYTMKDIGGLAGRISNLETYVSLNLLEQQVANMHILDANGLNRYKNGIFVDPLNNHDNGNTTSPEYNCTLDFDKGEMVPNQTIDIIDLNGSSLNPSPISSANVRVHQNLVDVALSADILTLDYTEKVFIEQNLNSNVIGVNPYAAQKWHGKANINPSSDIWFDTNYLPTVNQSFGTIVAPSSSSKTSNRRKWWLLRKVGSKEDLAVLSARRAAGIPHRDAGMTDFTVNAGWRESVLQTTSTTITHTTVPTSSSSTSDRLVSSRLIEWMRPRAVQYTLQAMRPNVSLTATFDNVNVDAHCTNLTVDQNGNCSGVFNIPAGTFKVGTKDLFFEDAEQATDAEASYFAKGTLNTRQQTITTIRSSVSTTSTSTKVKRRRLWVDPIAESILVDTKTEGVFLSSIDAFFSQKDANLPVTLEIVTMDNGSPTQEIIPLSSVTLNPVDVSISDNGFTPTTFTFSAPVFLQDGQEYAVVLTSNSDKYLAWYAKQGEASLLNAAGQSLTNRGGAGISKQPYLGVMFKSQNSSTWSEDQSSDLKLVIRRCDFSLAQGEYFFDVATVTNKDITSFMANIHNVTVPGTSIEIAYSTDGTNWTVLENATQVDLTSVLNLDSTGGVPMQFRLRMNTTNGFLSPVVDLNRAAVNTTMNLVDANNRTGVYVSKQVKLVNPAKDLRLLIDEQIAPSAGVNVYFSTQSAQIPLSLTNEVGYYDLAISNTLKGKTVFVYHRAAVTGNVTKVGSAIPTKLDTTNTFLSNISNIDIFDAPANITTYATTDKVFFSTTDGITLAPDWVAGTHNAGEYVFHAIGTQNKLWVCTAPASTTATPAANITDWTEVAAMTTTDAVTAQTAVTWRPMVVENTLQQGFDANANFYEYTYVPDSIIDEPFSAFTIKIELTATNAAQISKVSKLRAIAAT